LVKSLKLIISDFSKFLYLVSGVVLANASLDIAFHDSYYVVAHGGEIYSLLLSIATLPTPLGGGRSPPGSFIL